MSKSPLTAPQSTSRDRFLNIAHRGASAVAPENTFAAFEAAIDAGASAVEMDLRLTADDRIVAIHDSAVDRTTDGTGNIDRLRAAQLAELDAGSWFHPRFAGERVPELEHVFERLGGRVPMVLHIKVSGRGVEERVVELARRHAVVDRLTISSHRGQLLRHTAKLEPGITTTLIAWFVDWWWWRWYVAVRTRSLGVDRISPKGSMVTPEMVRYFHDRGIAVRAWGVGRDENLASRLIRMEVDGMTFDDPNRLWQIHAASREEAHDAR